MRAETMFRHHEYVRKWIYLSDINFEAPTRRSPGWKSLKSPKFSRLGEKHRLCEKITSHFDMALDTAAESIRQNGRHDFVSQ